MSKEPITPWSEVRIPISLCIFIRDNGALTIAEQQKGHAGRCDHQSIELLASEAEKVFGKHVAIRFVTFLDRRCDHKLIKVSRSWLFL